MRFQEADSNTYPYMRNGRYHSIFLESDGIDRKITTSDIEGIELEGNYLVMPEGFHIMDIVIDFNTTTSDVITSRAIDIRFEKDGRQSLFLPNASNFDYGYIYILGHF